MQKYYLDMKMRFVLMNKVFGCLIVVFYISNARAQTSWQLIDTAHPEVGQMMEIPVYFDLDKFQIRGDAAALLDTLVIRLSVLKGAEFRVESYTDCRASREYNQDLSQRRADSIAAFMNRLAKGNLKFIPVGIGEDSLKNDCHCEGQKRMTITRYTEDTINGIPQNRSVMMWDSNGVMHSFSKKEMMNQIRKSAYCIPCNESEHQRNRRTVLRLVALRKP